MVNVERMANGLVEGYEFLINFIYPDNKTAVTFNSEATKANIIKKVSETEFFREEYNNLVALFNTVDILVQVLDICNINKLELASYGIDIQKCFEEGEMQQVYDWANEFATKNEARINAFIVRQYELIPENSLVYSRLE